MSDTPDPNTHLIQPKITGYRKLSAQETELINEGKALAEQVGAFIHRLRMQPPTPVHGDPFPGSIDQRWVSIGATQLQQGFMALIRGIAQPSTF